MIKTTAPNCEGPPVESDYRSFFEHAVEGFFQTTPEGRTIAANPAMAQIFGFASPAELMAQSTDIAQQRYVNPADREEFQRRIAKHDSVVGFECKAYRKDRSQIWVSVCMRTVRDAAGNIVCYEGTAQDITESVRTRQRLLAFAKLGRKLSVVDDSKKAARIIVDIADELFGWDSCKVDLYDAQADRCHSILTMDVVNGQRQECAPAYSCTAPSPRLRSVLEKGPQLVSRQEPITLPADGQSFGDMGRPSASLMEVPLRSNGVIIGAVCTQSYRINAYTKQDLVVLQDLADHCVESLGRIQRRMESDRNNELLSQREEQLQNLLAALLASEHALIRAQAVAQIGNWQLDLQRNVLTWSTEVYRIFGLPEDTPLTYGSFLACVHPEDRDMVDRARQAAIQGVPYDFEHRIIAGKAVKWVREMAQGEFAASGALLNCIGTIQDITERRKLEEQLRQSQKMEAIGTLAGGVAHDFNNLLTVIQGHATLIDETPVMTPDVRDSVTEINAAAERAATLTRQLLTFSRQQPVSMANHDLNALITGLDRMVRRIVGEQVCLELRLAQHPVGVRADSGMLDQAVLNLIVNARDAMPDGGRITIATAELELDAVTAALDPAARPGRYALLTVSDTGTGIPPEVLPHIFDPFFTTKGAGRGTGLGLATVFGIVQQHEGWITVDSTPGRGTTFRLHLPWHEVAGGVKPAAPRVDRIHGGGETILLVEDDDAVREFETKVLERSGYRVLTAASGVAALAVWAAHRDRIQLLLTDMALPEGIQGRELGESLLAERPGLPVIYASGYAAEHAAPGLTLVEGQNFMSKPFSILKLAALVRRRLDEVPA